MSIRATTSIISVQFNNWVDEDVIPRAYKVRRPNMLFEYVGDGRSLNWLIQAMSTPQEVYHYMRLVAHFNQTTLTYFKAEEREHVALKGPVEYYFGKRSHGKMVLLAVL